MIHPMEQLIEEINRLKREKNAIVLGHFYVRPEVQAIADYLGDSLGLSRVAGETNADIIVFCGVEFMAETASIISPDKKVLIPVKGAGCTLAESVTMAGINTWKVKHPDGIVVSYVNTTAEVKAVTDYCVTSANALKIVQQLPKDRPILFGPDRNLGRYVSLATGREMDLWQGDCYVHRYITPEVVIRYLEQYPEAELLLHPEAVACSYPEVLDLERVVVGSTTTIMTRPGESNIRQFLIATEPETLAELTRRYPDLEFIPVIPEHTCEYMKLTTLEDVRDALLLERYEVKVPSDIRDKAIIAIDRMLELS
ncbi:Quinolinate synthase A [Porphyromonas levii]|uniref:Quinolinate synthase n=1 Tax=Porphyromonas levii TaxID=28114 RepID=A0A4Y8WS64_9PORP|nr:quinolinate synthase NadA [Porphyromonas levii]MBR8760388.1 Quinolinate synthase A [Porphyromonas levii]MBR8784980.1 Quinolinate synthase A [Porphyromonas levii]TFH96575.1 quinolinate synthase NadA [Porphyromonas levii]TFH97421.1 quinolinate synthase NadA [Porphyromonas levii]